MQRTDLVSRKWLHVLQPVLLAFLILFTVVTVLAGKKTSVKGEESARVYRNLFEYRMCLAHDINWCPNGDDFQATLFNQMYITPTLGADPVYFWDSTLSPTTTVMVPHYPTATTGALTRYAVDFCEAGTPTLDGHCPTVYNYDVIRCLDGTRPLFYFEPGQGEYTNRWLLKIQGGGSACHGDCPDTYLNPTNRAAYSSAYNENASRSDAQGIYSNSPANIFRN